MVIAVFFGFLFRKVFFLYFLPILNSKKTVVLDRVGEQLSNGPWVCCQEHLPKWIHEPKSSQPPSKDCVSG